MGMQKCGAGILTRRQLESSGGYTMERAKTHKGALVLIECVEDIPCNPCETVCPYGAISVGMPITNTPVVDTSKCNGCGQCVAICPGLAVFLINYDAGGGMSELSLAYEYLPVPQKGDIVTATDRGGEALCEAEVVRVVSPEKFNFTNVVTIRFPAGYAGDVRGIKRLT